MTTWPFRLSRLRVVTLEGAIPGRRILDSLGLRAVRGVRGPLGASSEFLRRTRTRATPLLLYVDSGGAVRARTVGELSVPEALRLDRPDALIVPAWSD